MQTILTDGDMDADAVVVEEEIADPILTNAAERSQWCGLCHHDIESKQSNT